MEKILIALQLTLERIEARTELMLAWVLCFVEAFWTGSEFLPTFQKLALPVINVLIPILAVSICFQIYKMHEAVRNIHLD